MDPNPGSDCGLVGWPSTVIIIGGTHASVYVFGGKVWPVMFLQSELEITSGGALVPARCNTLGIVICSALT